jgi:hypothetical protein
LAANSKEAKEGDFIVDGIRSNLMKLPCDVGGGIRQEFINIFNLIKSQAGNINIDNYT